MKNLKRVLKEKNEEIRDLRERIYKAQEENSPKGSKRFRKPKQPSTRKAYDAMKAQQNKAIQQRQKNYEDQLFIQLKLEQKLAKLRLDHSNLKDKFAESTKAIEREKLKQQLKEKAEE